jgi:hypothetical protein
MMYNTPPRCNSSLNKPTKSRRKGEREHAMNSPPHPQEVAEPLRVIADTLRVAAARAAGSRDIPLDDN